MTNSRRPSTSNEAGEHGQVLLLSLAAFVLLLMLFFLLVNAGRLILEKERVRARTDVVAFSGGVDYARALNLAAVSNKLLGISVATIPFFGLTVPKAIQQGQDVFAGTGKLEKELMGQKTALGAAPLAAEASMMHLAAQNGLLSLPLWNQKEFKNLTDVKVMPSLNLHRRSFEPEAVNEFLKNLGPAWDKVDKTVGSFMKKKAPKVWEALEGIKGETFGYTRRSDGIYVEVDPDKVVTESYGGKHGRTAHRYDGDDKSRFVSKKNFIKIDVPLDLVDEKPHSLTVIGCGTSGLPLPGFLKRLMGAPGDAPAGGTPRFFKSLPPMLAISRVEIGGGTVEVFEFENSGCFAPYFVPVNKDPGKKIDFRLQLPRTGIGMVDGMLTDFENRITAGLFDRYAFLTQGIRVIH